MATILIWAFMPALSVYIVTSWVAPRLCRVAGQVQATHLLAVRWGEPLKSDLTKTCALTAVLAAVTIATVALAPSNAQGKEIGDLSDLHAWVDRTLPGSTSIHATGKITAPTPCYEATAEYAGLDENYPPLYLVKITLRSRPGYCIQAFGDISFSYTQLNYAGHAEKMTVFSGQNSNIIPVEIVH